LLSPTSQLRPVHPSPSTARRPTLPVVTPPAAMAAVDSFIVFLYANDFIPGDVPNLEGYTHMVLRHREENGFFQRDQSTNGHAGKQTINHADCQQVRTQQNNIDSSRPITFVQHIPDHRNEEIQRQSSVISPTQSHHEATESSHQMILYGSGQAPSDQLSNNTSLLVVPSKRARQQGDYLDGGDEHDDGLLGKRLRQDNNEAIVELPDDNNKTVTEQDAESALEIPIGVQIGEAILNEGVVYRLQHLINAFRKAPHAEANEAGGMFILRAKEYEYARVIESRMDHEGRMTSADYDRLLHEQGVEATMESRNKIRRIVGERRKWLQITKPYGRGILAHLPFANEES
ncbi:hypothetical protein DM02DRAFT_685885, partial [Periconia macrospinosa]